MDLETTTLTAYRFLHLMVGSLIVIELICLMSSRELVIETFEGRANRIPLYFLMADPVKEAAIGDIVGVRCWLEAFQPFLTKGGPFRRRGLSYREWSQQLDAKRCMWPDIDHILREVDAAVSKVASTVKGKFLQAGIIGPTEYSEYSCSPGSTKPGRHPDEVAHQFDFAVLTRIDSSKAEEIHRRFFEIVLEAVKRAANYDEIGSIRVADDFCDYRGSIYGRAFTDLILERQAKLSDAIKAGGKYAVLHADGNIVPYLDRISRAYDGVHPLDICSKSTLSAALSWSSRLQEVRQAFPRTVFFTGIPIDLLCNSEISVADLMEVVKNVIRNVGSERLVLTTTHRPYPGWSFRDFEEKACALRRFIMNRDYSRKLNPTI